MQLQGRRGAAYEEQGPVVAPDGDGGDDVVDRRHVGQCQKHVAPEAEGAAEDGIVSKLLQAVLVAVDALAVLGVETRAGLGRRDVPADGGRRGRALLVSVHFLDLAEGNVPFAL